MYCENQPPDRDSGKKMRIEAVTVCVDYADFLAHTIMFTKQAVDRLVVVTSPMDEATRRLCEYHDVEYVTSTRFYEPTGWSPKTHGQGRMYKPPFAKAKGINDGLKVLDQSAWVIHLDADIALPPRTRDMLELASLDPTYVYGIDRLFCRSFEDWCQQLAYPELMHDANIFVRANTFPFHVRVAAHREDGWIPIGFFQMWNPSVSGIADYPEDHNSAGRTDMLHGRKWPREKRALIPEIVGIHLESETVHMSANWEGRRTKYFGPAGMERHQAQHGKKEWL